MSRLILGEHPEPLIVRLVISDPATLVATLTNGAGSEIDWPVPPVLEFGYLSDSDDALRSFTATIDGSSATWTLSVNDVEDLADLRAGARIVRCRIQIADIIAYAGKVDWNRGWTGENNIQRISVVVSGNVMAELIQARDEAVAAAAESAASALLAEDSASSADMSADAAATSATAASGSASAAAGSASAAAGSASDSAGSAGAASGSASTAAGSATAADTARAAAVAARTGAETARTGAEAAQAGAETAKTSAETAAETTTTQAGIATTKASEASTSAGTASTQAGTATTQAGIATTKAGEALASANAAAASATTASTIIRTGTGSPLGVVSAPVGTEYRDLAGTNGAWVWQKRTGGSGNTGWICVDGDTGWRNLSAFINATQMTAGTLYWRRKGTDLIWSLNNATFTAVSGNVATGLTGTQADPWQARGFAAPIIRANGVFGVLGTNGPGIVAASGSAITSTLNSLVVCATDVSWPTSLPGAAVAGSPF